jgi:hypothetical protein
VQVRFPVKPPEVLGGVHAVTQRLAGTCIPSSSGGYFLDTSQNYIHSIISMGMKNISGADRILPDKQVEFGL